MKSKWLIISLSVIFVLTALTFYANKAIFPSVIKKIAIEQAEHFLKRKVEIESLRFNWLKGVMINKIKIYQKDSSSEVLAQAERISLGFIFIPGGKQHKLVLPSIHIDSPSLHLIHRGNNQWNFSDMLELPVSDKPSPVAVSVGGLSLTNGKIRLDDLQSEKVWTELFDQINLKIGLSSNGISMDGTVSIPQKQGLISIVGAYQPLNKTFKAKLNIRNIKPAEYMQLIPVPLPFSINDGTINKILASVEYTPERILIRGDWSIKNIDVVWADYKVKSNMDVAEADIILEKQKTLVKGIFSLANTKIVSPVFSLTGSIKADVENFLMNSPEDISIKASLGAQDLNINLPGGQSFQGNLNAAINQGHWQKDSGLFEGTIDVAQTVLALNDKQSLQGNLRLSNATINKAKDSIKAKLDLKFYQLDIRMPGQILKGNLEANELMMNLDHQNNLTLDGPVSWNGFDIMTEQARAQGFLHLKKLSVTLDQKEQLLEAKTEGTLKEAKIKLNPQGLLNTSADFKMQFLFPIKNPSALDYKGSILVNGGSFEGLPFGPLNNIRLTADIKTDQAVIQNLSLTVLDTPISASGHILNFLKPVLSIEAKSDRIDLSKINDVAPDFLKTHGLSIDGTTSFQLKFEGLAADPLSGKINAQAVLKDVNIESSTLKQSVKNIAGTLKADGDSLSWEDFTGTFLNKTATLTGRLTDFKNPKIKTTLACEGIELNAEIQKNNNIININDVSGHYLSAMFHASGTADLSGKTPELNIKNDLKFKLEDLSILWPDRKKELEPLKLTGLIVLDSSLKGPASDWKNWILQAQAHSDLVTIAGFKFNDLNITLDQEAGKVNNFKITSTFYDGALNIVTTADLNVPSLPFETALRLENADLSKLKNDTGAKEEELRGFITATTMVDGKLQNILNIKGNGSLSIAQGYLMKKEFTSLFLIPELSNLIFTDASANFVIADQKVSTENLMLKSEGATLNGTGRVGFDHKIQLTLNPEFNTDKIIQSESLKKGTTALFATALGKYLTINIDGTLEKPQVHTIKKPTEIIKRTGEIITDNVGQILQGIFQ